MKIKKNWSQSKEPSRPWLQAPSTQRTEVSEEKPDTSSEHSLTNYQDNIEVLPRLNHDNSSDDELSDDQESDDQESDDQDSESDDLLVNKLVDQILHEKLKERGINIPNNPAVKNKTGQTIKPACKSRIIQPRGLTDFLPGIFSDSSSLMAAAVGAALLVTTCLIKKANYTSVGQTNRWQVY